jgi:hypothetical protein
MANHLKNKKLRNSVITASQAWDVIYDRKKLWREKTGKAEPFQGNEMTQWGNDNEYRALSAFEREMNTICKPGNEFVVHSELPLGGSPDGYYFDEETETWCPVELKCPYSGKVYPTIPERYYFQCQIQMAVTNTTKNFFFVWTEDDTKLEVIPFNKDFMTWYLPYALDFIKMVQDNEEPPRWKRKPIFNKE